MRIEILTQDDSLYILPLFEDLFRACASEFEITQVSCCRTMGKMPARKLAKSLYSLYGPAGFARLLYRRVRDRLISRLPANRDSARFYGLNQLCRAFSVAFQQIEDPNAPHFLEGLKQRAPDLIVSVACPYILKRALLNIPPLGCINIHHAPLPRYQGMMPTFWQMFHQEREVGLTIHYMTEKVDDGAILLQESLPIQEGEVMHDLMVRGKRHGAHCMATVLRMIRDGRQSGMPSPSQKEKSYFTFPTLAEIREFRRRGFRAV